MPRDSAGLYTLPLGNPVVDGTVIEATWANTTMLDIAVQMNNVVTRDGLLSPTGPLQYPDGNVATPAISFASQANMGFYKDSANTIGVSVGGVNVFKFSSTFITANKALVLPNGTAPLPSLRFAGSTNTGFYWGGTNFIGVQVAGSQACYFTNAGVFGNQIDFDTGTIDTVNAITTNTEDLYINQNMYVAGNPASLVPTGTVLDFAGSTLPSGGYLLCDGSAVSRSTYSRLFAVIGTTWGAGNGSTTFNVPDLRRYVTVGAGGTAGSGPANTLGAKGGVELNTITTTHMPGHNHTINETAHTHVVNNPAHTHGITDPSHAHAYIMKQATGGFAGGGDPQNLGLQAYATDPAYTGISINNATTAVSINSASTGITTNSAGSGAAINNMQPSAVVNKIIKT